MYPQASNLISSTAANAVRVVLIGFFITVLIGCSSASSPKIPDVSLPVSLPDVTQVKLPFVHRIDVQQGNEVTQEMIAQLEYGMDKKKVRYIMGTPMIRDTFHAKRWDYLYTFQAEGGDIDRRRVTLYFEDELLASVDGNIQPAAGRLVVDTRQDTSVEVPGMPRKGFLKKIKDSMPLIGEDDVEDAAEDEAEALADKAEGAEETEEELLAKAEELADKDAVVVPADAPVKKKKRGFFRRIFDSVGLGAEEDEEDEVEYDTADPRYRSQDVDPDNT